jgi:hypothetical protein
MKDFKNLRNFKKIFKQKKTGIQNFSELTEANYKVAL